ncbi:hypothetical protein Tco_0924099 [Tanacetum coccineum]|uniref:Uncharacterized protein n=1 Tax=Tanacetum coccineum TaxID=301880 RepID=A0ABQ5D2V4_9ASTR
MVPTLITKVDSLETELKQTKQTMGKAIGRKFRVEDNMKLLKAKISGRQTLFQVVCQAAETLVQLAVLKDKTYTKELILVSRRKLWNVEVSSVIERFKSAMRIKSDSQILVLVKSESAKEKERKYLKNNLSLKDQRNRLEKRKPA